MDLQASLPPSPAWATLFRPLLPVLRAAVARLGPGELPRFEQGPAEGPWARLEGEGVVLRGDLLYEGARTPSDEAWAQGAPAELASLALDRWRRAASAALEGVILWRGRASASEWAEAEAAEAADRLEPSLGALWPELADLRRTADPQVGPDRRGAWLVRWARARGVAVEDIDDAGLAAFFTWIRDGRRGPAADSPLPLPLAPGCQADEWVAPPCSAKIIRFEAGPTGALLTVEGIERGEPSRLPAATPREIIVASRLGGPRRLRAAPLGPVGRWALTTGVVQERVGAARGVELSLLADGRLEIVLADGFMGLPTTSMLELAESLGVSGWASGRWSVIEAGEGSGGALRLEGVRSRGLTVHPRGGHGFAVPASSLLGPAERILAALSGAELRWRTEGDALTLEGPIAGVPAELRFRAAAS